jgi:hypothetical protein
MKLDTVGRYLREYVKRSQVGHLTASELHARLGEPGLHVLDCNLEPVWRRGHVPGAVYVGWDGLSKEQLPTDLDAALVFYCGSSL